MASIMKGFNNSRLILTTKYYLAMKKEQIIDIYSKSLKDINDEWNQSQRITYFIGSIYMTLKKWQNQRDGKHRLAVL